MDIRGHHHFAWHFEARMCSQRLNCCYKSKSFRLGLWICLCKQIPPMPIISSVRNHSVGEGGGVEGWTSHEPNDNKMSRWVGGPVMNWKAIKSGDNWSRGVSARIPSQYDPALRISHGRDGCRVGFQIITRVQIYIKLEPAVLWHYLKEDNLIPNWSW